MTAAELRELLRARLGGLPDWWPAASDFETAVGAILVQGVAWRNAQRAVAGLGERGLLAPRALADAPRGEVEECLRPALYFRQKAGYVQDFAAWVAGELGGDLGSLARLGAAGAERALRARRGIGAETAGAIAVYALGFALPVVDAYALRILVRCGAIPPRAGPATARAVLAGAIAESAQAARELHAGIVELARRSCRKVPVCASCALAAECPRLPGNTSPGRWQGARTGRSRAAAQEGGDGWGAARAPVEGTGRTGTRAVG